MKLYNISNRSQSINQSIVALKAAVLLPNAVLLFASSMMFDVVTSFVSPKSKEAICFKYVVGGLPCLAFPCSGVYNANIFAGSLSSRRRSLPSHPSCRRRTELMSGRRPTVGRMSSFGTWSNRRLIEQIMSKIVQIQIQTVYSE